MARPVIFSKLGEGGTVSVQGAALGNRTFGKDAIADLDDVVVPATKDRPAVTLADALAAYAHLYEPHTAPGESARSARRRPEPMSASEKE